MPRWTSLVPWVASVLVCVWSPVVHGKQASANSQKTEVWVESTPYLSLLRQRPGAEFLEFGFPVSKAGVIVDQNDKPVANATVAVYPILNTNGHVQNPMRPTPRATAAIVQTLSGGEYRFRNSLVPIFSNDALRRDAVCVVFADGYALEWFSVPSSGTMSSQIKNEDFKPMRLTPAKSLEGRVVDDQKKPVSGADVYLDTIYEGEKWLAHVSTTFPGAINLSGMTIQPHVKTDSNGQFAFDCMKPGSVGLVRVVHPDFAPTVQFRPTDATSPTQPPEGRFMGEYLRRWEDVETDIRLARGEPIQVRCIDHPSGESLNGVEICFVEHGQALRSNTNGIIRGRVRQWPGSVRADLKQQTFTFLEYRLPDSPIWNNLIVTNDEVQKGLKLLTLQPQTFVKGQVTDAESGEGVPGVTVRIERNTRETAAITNADGSYKLPLEFPANSRAKLAIYGPVRGYDLPVRLAIKHPDAFSAKIPDDLDTTVNFSVQPLPPIRIRVESTSGQPVAARVYMIPDKQRLNYESAYCADDSTLVFPISRLLNGYAYAICDDDRRGLVELDGTPTNEPVLIVVSADFQFTPRLQNLFQQINLLD